MEVSVERPDKIDHWTKKWMSYDESVLNFYKDPLKKDQDSFSIPMDKVISFRADVIQVFLSFTFIFLIFFSIEQ